jgi:hypothetical protein
MPEGQTHNSGGLSCQSIEQYRGNPLYYSQHAWRTFAKSAPATAFPFFASVGVDG